MSSFRLGITVAVQAAALVIAYRVIRLVSSGRRKSITWVVGPRETASMVMQLRAAIPGSHSVSLAKHDFYADNYDSVLRASGGVRGKLAGLIGPPVLLARLMNRAEGFIYVGQTGFLERSDYRRFEFAFLKRHGLAICCYFTGTDIRAPRLMYQLAAEMGRPNISTQQRLLSDVFDSDTWDTEKRGLAAVADRYADVSYSCAVDQLSYLKHPTEPFSYFLPDAMLLDRFDKFDDVSTPVIVHAPSSPQLKGTPAVREAIERLRSEGRQFEYVELIGVGNDVVLAELARAHIVLNQFYAFMPGVFGAEALGACCAVLMSADDRIETDLPAGSNEAWFVTNVDEIYEHLGELFATPALMERYARAGSRWAREQASAVSSGTRLNSVLASVLDGSYEPGRK